MRTRQAAFSFARQTCRLACGTHQIPNETPMTRVRLLVLAAVMIPLVGCKWIDEIVKKNQTPRGGTEPLPPVEPERLVRYVNERAARLQSLYYDDVRLVASDHGVRMPANLTGILAASQPHNFRMKVKSIPATVDLGSNDQQFWVYFDGAGSKPVYVYASHTDFKDGRARLEGLPFEPEWVMQSLGMTTLSLSNKYNTPLPDQKKRTYTLSWPATLPDGTSVVKEIVFDGDPATGTKPQVQKHLVHDTEGKLICSAEIKQAQTVQLTQSDTRTGLPLAVQYPTLVVLWWEKQKFQMELDLKLGKKGSVNKGFTQEEARTYFNKPTISGTPAVDLAGGVFPLR